MAQIRKAIENDLDRLRELPAPKPVQDHIFDAFEYARTNPVSVAEAASLFRNAGLSAKEFEKGARMLAEAEKRELPSAHDIAEYMSFGRKPWEDQSRKEHSGPLSTIVFPIFEAIELACRSFISAVRGKAPKDFRPARYKPDV